MDELAVLDIILNHKVGEIISDEVRKKIEELDRRIYKSRFRSDFFDL